MSSTLIPRIVVSGLRGGSGKTVLSLSLLAGLRRRGLPAAPFKKGPDYIDAGWLAKAADVPCYNLDLFMMTPGQALHSFVSHTEGASLAVIEGNRGLYDGMDEKGTYSTAELAKLLKAPVVLIVDCTKTTSTIAALVLGCQRMDPDVMIRGVVLNRVATGRQEAVIRQAIRERCGIPVLGAIPRMKKDPFPERHMGLTPFQEHRGIEDSLAAMADIGETYLDLDAMVKAAERAGELHAAVTDQSSGVWHPESGIRNLASGISDQRPRIGIIRDSAFQFYYPDNIEELRRRGAELAEVSPLHDDALPDLDGLYIGGGFPETHAIGLAENRAFRGSLRAAVEAGLPVYAECGGLMYLGKELVLEGRTYPMTGALDITFGMERKPCAHGYSVVEVERENPYFQQGRILKGHEFHYSRVLHMDQEGTSMAFSVRRGQGIVDNKDGICYKNVLAAYTHLHALGTPEWADGLVRCAKKYKEGAKDSRGHGAE